MAEFYLYSGIVAGLYAVYAGFQYYTYSGIGYIPKEEAKKALKSGKIKVVIDVRTNLEWNLGHYPGAKHIPIAVFSEKKMRGISKKTPILVYCRTGQRSRRGAELLKSYGYENVYYTNASFQDLV